MRGRCGVRRGKDEEGRGSERGRVREKREGRGGEGMRRSEKREEGRRKRQWRYGEGGEEMEGITGGEWEGKERGREEK